MTSLPLVALTQAEADELSLTPSQHRLLDKLVRERVASVALALGRPDAARVFDPLKTSPVLTSLPVGDEDTAYTESLWDEHGETKTPRRCVSCGGSTTRRRMADVRSMKDEYSNALVIDFVGGYGMFFDSLPTPCYTVVLCHSCAHEACERLPWLAALIDPHSAHSHSALTKTENPDHYGWDYDREYS